MGDCADYAGDKRMTTYTSSVFAKINGVWSRYYYTCESSHEPTEDEVMEKFSNLGADILANPQLEIGNPFSNKKSPKKNSSAWKPISRSGK